MIELVEIEKRVAAALAYTMPSRRPAPLRFALCVLSETSLIASTGARQASVPSDRATHSWRLRVRNTCAKRSFVAGHWLRSICGGSSSGATPITSRSAP